jgi:hypothetical protein
VTVVQVEFAKCERNGRCSCPWEAVRGKRTLVPGAVMAVGKGLPHDLAQYVIEAATGYDNGFWGLVAKGATFKSTGRRRTKPGRAVIAEHRQELIESEPLAGRYLGLWKAGVAGPVTTALDLAFRQWQDLRVDQRLVFHWPSADGMVVDWDLNGTGHGSFAVPR